MTTPNMALDKPIVSSTTGPLWATMLNAISDLVDAHDHTSGKGALVPTAGLNINASLAFGSFDATGLRSTRFTSQSAVFSLAADVGCVYVKSGELFYRDTVGANVQITSGGVLNAAALNANTFPQQDVSADYNVLSTNANTHFSVDASAANRIITLPKAADVSAGRFYIVSDRLGSCIPSGTPRTITIQREGTSIDTIDGATSVVINIAYGAVWFVRTSSTTWKVLRAGVGASATAFGAVKLTQDFGGTADLPEVVALTGSAGVASMRMASLAWQSSVTGPTLSQSQSASGTGKSMTIAAQSGGVTGTNAGGSVLLKGGAGTGGGADGHVVLEDGSGNEVLSARSGSPNYLRISSTALFNKTADGNIGFEPLTSSGAGRALGITGQNGLTSGAGGSIQMNAGAGAAAGGGSITMIAGGGGGAAANGGSLSLISGAGAGSGLPGLISLSVNSFNSLTALALAAAQRVVAIAEIPTTTHLPAGTGDGVLWMGRATVAPTTLPTRGWVACSDAGDNVTFVNGNGKLAFTCGTALSASAGAVVSPGNFAGYIQVLVNGATKNIPYFN